MYLLSKQKRKKIYPKYEELWGYHFITVHNKQCWAYMNIELMNNNENKRSLNKELWFVGRKEFPFVAREIVIKITFEAICMPKFLIILDCGS